MDSDDRYSDVAAARHPRSRTGSHDHEPKSHCHCHWQQTPRHKEAPSQLDTVTNDLATRNQHLYMTLLVTGQSGVSSMSSTSDMSSCEEVSGELTFWSTSLSSSELHSRPEAVLRCGLSLHRCCLNNLQALLVSSNAPCSS